MICDNPIFIMANSPRSGSTWVQRCLTSTRECLIWGENYHSSPFFHANNGENLDWVEYAEKTMAEFREHGANSWMAIMHPLKSDVLEAYRLFFERLFGVTAKHEGFQRWGKKEVRWNAKHYGFLRELYPNCHIIFLVRKFRHSFFSLFNFEQSAKKWDNQKRREELIKFCNIWIDQTRFIVDRMKPDQIRNAKDHVVLYEDLLADFDGLERLATACGLGSVSQEVSKTKISFSGVRKWDRSNKETPCDFDFRIILDFLPQIYELEAQFNYREKGDYEWLS